MPGVHSEVQRIDFKFTQWNNIMGEKFGNLPILLEINVIQVVVLWIGKKEEKDSDLVNVKKKM